MEIMIRYYDTVTKTETHTESDTTIISTDDRVREFFKPLEEGKKLEYTDDGLPLIVDIPTPTAAELASAKANAYKALRQAEYPPMSDYLDGIVKGDQVQIDKYISDCQAVKDKYPKGE
jgi:hypothetical protein